MTLDPDRSAPTIRTLIRRCAEGEKEAATELYLRYFEKLRRLAQHQTSRKLTARVNSEEIVQSVFRTFFRRVSGGQYRIAESDELWKLLLVMTLNKIRRAAQFHHAQKRDVGKTRSIDWSQSDLKALESGSDVEAHSVLKLTIDEELATLPEKHRDMIRLRIDGYSLPEIAGLTGRAQRTVERVLQSFREKLLAQLKAPDP